MGDTNKHNLGLVASDPSTVQVAVGGKKLKQELKVIYQLSTADPPEEVQRRIDRAFDVLFEIVLKDYDPLKTKKHEES